MIDIQNKKIINGYGTIGVAPTNWGIRVIHIRPPKEVGSEFRDEDAEILHTVHFDMPYSELSELLETLNEVSKNNPTLKINGWTISFEKFNEKSLDTWKFKVNQALLLQSYVLNA